MGKCYQCKTDTQFRCVCGNYVCGSHGRVTRGGTFIVCDECDANPHAPTLPVEDDGTFTDGTKRGGIFRLLALLVAVVGMFLFAGTTLAESEVADFEDPEFSFILDWEANEIEGEIIADPSQQVDVMYVFSDQDPVTVQVDADADGEPFTHFGSTVKAVQIVEEDGSYSGLVWNRKLCPEIPYIVFRRLPTTGYLHTIANDSTNYLYYNKVGVDDDWLRIDRIGGGSYNWVNVGFSGVGFEQQIIAFKRDPASSAPDCGAVFWNVDIVDPAILMKLPTFGMESGQSIGIPLFIENVNGDARTLGGKICFDHSAMEFRSASPGDVLTSKMKRNFAAHDDGECVTFGASDSEQVIVEDGIAAIFNFRSKHVLGIHTLEIRDPEVGPYSTVLPEHGKVTVSVAIGGNVVSFNGLLDLQTGYTHSAQGRSREMRVRPDGTFWVETRVPGDHELRFYSLSGDKDQLAAKKLSNLAVTFLCYLGMLKGSYCPMMTLDVNVDGRLSMTDVLFHESNILGIDEGERSKIGIKRYDPNPISLPDLKYSQTGFVVTSAVIGDPLGFAYKQTAQASNGADVVFNQDGTITIRSDQPFHAAQVQLDGAIVRSVVSGDRETGWNGSMLVVYGDRVVNEMTINVEVDGQISSMKAEVSDPIEGIIGDPPKTVERIYLPNVAR